MDPDGEIKEDLLQDVNSNVWWATGDARSKLIHYERVQYSDIVLHP